MTGANDQKPRWISGIEPSAELLRANGTDILEIECREQPARLRELITHYGSDPIIQAQLESFRALAARKGPRLFHRNGSFLLLVDQRISASPVAWAAFLFD